MFEGYEGKSGQQAVQEVYPITSEGRLVDTIKKRHIHERNVVRSSFVASLLFGLLPFFLPFSL
jgi:hypothetical protein